MGRYLSAQVIEHAIERLAASRALSGFTDFLVLKRALVRSSGSSVAFSMKDSSFTKAMDDLAGTCPGGVDGVQLRDVRPYVKVFGTLDYVSIKYKTNGAADTLSGPSWRSVVRTYDSRPRRGALEDGYVQHLASRLLKSGSYLPGLADAAIWYHRAIDLEASFGAIVDVEQLDDSLRASFIERVGLTPEEIDVIFDESARPLQGLELEDVLSDSVADPTDYLPSTQNEVAANDDLRHMLAAFQTKCNGESVSLHVGPQASLRFVASLGAKRFLILSGLAGSGKTILALAFARWLTPGAPNGQAAAYAVVPVGADWTGNDNILGYPDGLDAARYVTRPALDLIQRAAKEENKDTPHFLILDEMNLSHVERYFADLLSLIESGEATELYQPDLDADNKPQKRSGVEPLLRLPPNLFIIGTVNVDETTYMFSPKVLDRANVIEFRMPRQDLAAFLAAPRSPNLNELDGRGSGYGEAFVNACGRKDITVPDAVRGQFEAEMLLFFDLLRDHNAEFGFRVVNEAARFMYFYRLFGGYSEDSTDWFDAAMDAVIVQKFLPKLHGSRPVLEGLLWALAYACGADRTGVDADAFLEQCRKAGTAQDATQFEPPKVEQKLAGAPARYPLSFDKIMRMYRKLIRDQFVTFPEA